MRRAGPLYLPPHPNETEDAYDARLRRTTLLNVLEDSIDNACARLFDEQVKLGGQIPPELLDWAKNIDLAGATLHEFCDMAMHHALADGQVHILVDFPSAVPVATGNVEGFGNPADRHSGAGAFGNGSPSSRPGRPVPGNGLGPRPSRLRGGQAYYAEQYDEEGLEPDQTGNGLNARRASYGAGAGGANGHEVVYDDDGNEIGGGGDGSEYADYEDVAEDDPDRYGPSGDPRNLPRMTLAEERMLGMRPYLCLIPHTNLLAIYTARMAGETIVTHVRILEEDVVRDGFAEKTVKRVRVIEPGRWEVWEQDEHVRFGAR